MKKSFFLKHKSYYSASAFDPSLGRFTSADTIVPEPGNPQAFNRYSYCDNNPINYTDPTGHWKLKDWIGDIIGGVVGVITFAMTGSFSLAMSAYGFVSGSINSYISGYGVGQSIGIGILTGTAAFIGGQIGGAFGDWVGGSNASASALGSAIFGGAFAGAAGGATESALTGGNVGLATGMGAAVGATMGLFMHGLTYDSRVKSTDQEKRVDNLQRMLDEAGSLEERMVISQQLAWQRVNDPNMTMGGLPDYAKRAWQGIKEFGKNVLENLPYQESSVKLGVGLIKAGNMARAQRSLSINYLQDRYGYVSNLESYGASLKQHNAEVYRLESWKARSNLIEKNRGLHQ